jgi:HK97 family phage major capsid protein
MAEKDPIESVMNAVEELQKTNDANLKKRDDNLEAKLANINAHLDKFEPMNQKLVLAEQQNKAMQDQMDRMEAILNRPNLGDANATAKENREFMAAFDRVMRKPGDQREAADVQLIQRRAAVIAGNDSSAGYLLAPPDMQTDIMKNVIEMTPIRSLATVRTISGPSFKRPKKTGSGAASRVGETALRTNTGDPAYGMLEFTAPEMFARIEVSLQMLEDSAYDLMAELREDSAEQFGVRTGSESIIGIGGAGQMEGILTNGDILSTNSGSAALITADGMFSLFYGLKTAYSKSAMWGMNRTTLGAIRKLKNGEGDYLWATGIASGVPNTIMGAPYAEMADMPDVAANAYPVVFADFKKLYVVVDRVGISFQADYTTGADNGLVVFRGRSRTGGGVMQPEAGRKLKCAA